VLATVLPEWAWATGTERALPASATSLPFWSWVWIGWAGGAIVLAHASGASARMTTPITSQSLRICEPP